MSDDSDIEAQTHAMPYALPPDAIPLCPDPEEIGRRLQTRWLDPSRRPGVLVADGGDVLVVRADGIRSRVAGVWRNGNGFTSAQLREMHRPATRFDWVRWQNEALRALPPRGDLARMLAAARAELPSAIVRRSLEGELYVRAFSLEASLVHGGWFPGNAFTVEQRAAMPRVADRAECTAIVAIAHAALGVPRCTNPRP